METIILILLMGGLNLLAFLIGAKTAQQVHNNEPIKLPNPIKVVEEIKEKIEEKKEQEKLEIMLENVDNYDGTEMNQKNIPE